MYHLKYNGKDLPVIVDFSVIKTACSKLKLTLQEFEQSITDLSKTETILFEAIKRGHKLEGIEFKYVESESEDILSFENNYADFLEIFGKCVLETFTPTSAKKKKQ